MWIHDKFVRFLGATLQGILAVVLLASAQPALALDCDVNNDGSIDRQDIDLVVLARNTPSSLNDPRDPNHDGSITVTDARVCVTRCSLPRCASGTVVSSMQLSLPQPIVGADSTLIVTPTVFDSSGKQIVPVPSVSYQVLPDANATAGPIPVVNGNQIVLPADTRGSFTIRGTVANSSVTADVRFTVIQNATQSANSGLYVTMSAAQSALTQNLAIISQALQNGDTGAIPAASAALAAAAASVDAEAMTFSTVYAPDSGFVPTAAELTSRGYGPTAGDAGFATITTQIRAKIGEITQLLNQPTGDDAADTAMLGQYADDLLALWNQSQLPANRPGINGLAKNAQAVSDLLAMDMPQVLKALISRVNAQLQLSGLALGPSSPKTLYGLLGNDMQQLPHMADMQSPVAMYASTQPVFGLTGLLGYAGPIGNLVQNIYGDYLDQVQKMYLLLAAQDLLNRFMSQIVGVDGLITGASQSFHVYHAYDSIIEVTGMSLADAQNADVFLIGGAAVNAVDGLVDQLRSVGSISSIEEMYNFFDGMLGAIRSAGEAYEDAHQQPDSFYQTSFWDGGCLSSLADSCVEMHYSTGFDYVGSGGLINIEPVIILVRGRSPLAPQAAGSNIYNFVGK